MVMPTVVNNVYRDDREDPRGSAPPREDSYDYRRSSSDYDEVPAVDVEIGPLRHSPTTGAISAALAAAQAEFRDAELDRTNSHLGSSYATLGSLKRASRPQLGKNGIAVLAGVRTMSGGMVTVETRMTHASDEWFSLEMTAKTVDQRGLISLQMLGVVVAYLKRYGYSAITGVEAAGDGEDDDGQSLTTGGAPQRSGPSGGGGGGQFLGALKAFESNAKVTCSEKTVAGVVDAFEGILAGATTPDAMKAAASLIGKFEAVERKDSDAQAAAAQMRRLYAERTKANGGGGVAARVAQQAAKPHDGEK